MTGPRPRILDELGRELVRAARAQEDGRGASHTGRGGDAPRARLRLPRALVLGLAMLLLAAAVAVAASLVIGRGDPLPPAPAGAVPKDLEPVPGSARLAGLKVADPDGGPAWDLRTSRSRTGAICTTLGQVLDGELGIVGLDRRFRALPPGAADTCSAPQRSGATLAGARAFRGGGRLTDLTVVNGVVAPSVREAMAIGGGRTVRLRLSSNGAFLAIFRGLPEQVRPRVVLTEADGRRTTVRFADTGEYLVPDPSGGAPWTLISDRGHVPGLRCVGARREHGPDSPYPLPQGRGVFNVARSEVRTRCGRRDGTFVIAQRFVPVAPRPGHGQVDRWGIAPARTIVLGAVADAADRVVVEAPRTAPRRVAVDPHTHGFVTVFDGHLDPRAVRVTVGGRALQPDAGVLSHEGKRVAPAGRPPSWRSVASVLRSTTRPQPFRPDRGTVRTPRRAADPTGGPAWEMRTWASTLDPRATARAADRRLLCFAIGIRLADGGLGLPRAGAPPRRVTLGEAEGFCNARGWLARHAGGALVRTYVDDPSAAAPTPRRVVVAGLLGPRARSAELLGAGAPRPLGLGRDGTFMVVLEPSVAGRPLRVRQVRADGSVQTSSADGVHQPCPVPPSRTFRIADPDGEAPWIAGRHVSDRRSCWFVARLVDGSPAALPDASGWVAFAPLMGGGGGAGGVTPRRSSPVSIWTNASGNDPRTLSAAPPTPAQVARRTLAGRTLIVGTATRAVETVTLRTPRDIRTVRPVNGAFLAVYDGAFYGGEIVAIAHLRDGRSVTSRLPAGLPF